MAAEDPRGAGKLKAHIADTGQYAFETTDEEYAGYQGDQPKIDELFRTLALERVRRWVDMAEDRLGTAGIRCLVSAGNNNFYEVDELLRASSLIQNPDGRVLDLGDGFEIMGIGYGNPTPWNCPRDIPEDELAAKIAEVADTVERPDRAIFNLHVPPHGSGLDFAPELDSELRMVMSGSGPHMIPVGSTAVHDAIMRYQPMLGLHGQSTSPGESASWADQGREPRKRVRRGRPRRRPDRPGLPPWGR